ncbi:MAG: tetratricopeptide repeat protein [Chloracidobacterium sp.]
MDNRSITETTLPEASQPTDHPPRWLYGRLTDLTIGCGLWSLPLLLVSYTVEPHFAGSFALAFYALALVCNYPHYAATWHRACATPAARTRYGTVLMWSSLATAAGLLLVHAHPPLLVWAFTLYVFWSPWHYTGQNYGIALMFARRNGLGALDRHMQRWLWGAFALPYAMLLTAFNSGASADPLLYSVELPPPVAKTLIGVFGAAFFLITFIIGRKLRQRHDWQASGPTLALLATQALWFIPAAGIVLAGEAVFQVRYTSGMLAVLHSAQYLWVTSHYARREQGAQWRPWSYVVFLFAVGVLLFIPGPWVASLVFGLDFTTSFLAFTALVNIHHFILDGAVWKLREPHVAAVLVRDQMADTPKAVAARTPWLRRLGLSAAVVGLAVLAGVDLIKFMLGGRTTDVAALTQAIQLNPNDALVAARLARLALAEGDRLRAREALEKVVAVNPYDAEHQAMLGQILIEQGEYDAAYRHYQNFHHHLPNNVAALVNLGTLAARQGAETDAMAAWERAVQLDPDGQPIAWANLGDAYMRANRHQDAAKAYEKGLQALPSGPEAQRQSLEWTLKLGDSYAAIGKVDAAERCYATVFEAASTLPALDLASVTATRQADLHAQHARLDRAAEHHHLAIRLAQESQSLTTQGAAWYEYALFMARHGASPELVFAACLQAETCFRNQGMSQAAVSTIQSHRQAAEDAVGTQAARIRAQLAETLDRARAWKPAPSR